MTTEREKVEALHGRLVEERRRILVAAAESGGTPAAGFLDRLSALDGTTAAVEAMLDRMPPMDGDVEASVPHAR